MFNFFKKEESAIIYYKNTKNAGYFEETRILIKPKNVNWDKMIIFFINEIIKEKKLKHGDIVITMFQKL